MTDKKFRKLVNLYLDKEISVKELSQLKDAIASDNTRRQTFNQFCKLHLAEQQVLSESSQDAVCRIPGKVNAFPAPAQPKPIYRFAFSGIAASITVLLFIVGVTVKQSPYVPGETGFGAVADSGGAQPDVAAVAINTGDAPWVAEANMPVTAPVRRSLQGIGDFAEWNTFDVLPVRYASSTTSTAEALLSLSPAESSFRTFEQDDFIQADMSFLAPEAVAVPSSWSERERSDNRGFSFSRAGFSVEPAR